LGTSIHEHEEHPMFEHQPDLPASEERVIEALVEEHVQVECRLVPIDEHTWAIEGSIAVDGEVILAEFDNPEEAELALEELAARLTAQLGEEGSS
jgi:hypothetical protein